MLAIRNPSTPWNLDLSTVRSTPVRRTLVAEFQRRSRLESNVDVDSRMPVQLFLQVVVNRPNPVWCGRDANVIQKREHGFQRTVLTQ